MIKTRRRIAVAVLTVIVLFIFSERVYAGDLDFSALKVYFYQYDYRNENGRNEDEDYGFIYEEIDLYGKFTEEQKAYIIYSNLFDGYIKSSVRLLGTDVQNEILTVNISSEIYSYGGNDWERTLVRLIMRNAFDLEDVDFVTVLINGKLDYLPEGTLVYEQVARKE